MSTLIVGGNLSFEWDRKRRGVGMYLVVGGAVCDHHADSVNQGDHFETYWGERQELSNKHDREVIHKGGLGR